MPFIPASPSAPCLHQAAWCLSANSYTCTIAKYVVKMPTYLSPNPTVCIYAKTIAWASSVTDSHSIVSVLLFCAGRCVRYTCWRTRFLCVQLSGRECLTPPASPVWRQVRGGHVSIVPSPPLSPVTLVMFIAIAFGNPDYYTRSHQHSPVLLLALIHRNVHICLGDTLCHNILKAFKFLLKNTVASGLCWCIWDSKPLVSGLRSCLFPWKPCLSNQSSSLPLHFIQSPGHVGVCLLRLSLGF